ncbi:MAG TPA: Spy/CpxP family protein refolding chaperone [Nevskiaceae bacterium]|nr:Spy/CpxP family protein refolding chaperone [Nevskiaceae bacterium]
MYKHLTLAVAAAAALGLAAPAFAADAGQATSSAPMMQAHHGWKHHEKNHHRHHQWPFARALDEVNLTDAQKQNVRKDLKATHEAIRGQMRGVMQARHAFDAAVPGTPEFTSAYDNYAHTAAVATQDRIQQVATLYTTIYNQLTPEQQKKLAKELAEEASESHGHHRD